MRLFIALFISQMTWSINIKYLITNTQWIIYPVTGNANFRMTQTSFTMFGFTQPQTALPIIEDVQNNAKGFTSRILWFFPEPVYCKMQDTRLTAEENSTVETFQNELGIKDVLYLHVHNCIVKITTLSVHLKKM